MFFSEEKFFICLSSTCKKHVEESRCVKKKKKAFLPPTEEGSSDYPIWGNDFKLNVNYHSFILLTVPFILMAPLPSQIDRFKSN